MRVFNISKSWTRYSSKSETPQNERILFVTKSDDEERCGYFVVMETYLYGGALIDIADVFSSWRLASGDVGEHVTLPSLVIGRVGDERQRMLVDCFLQEEECIHVITVFA